MPSSLSSFTMQSSSSESENIAFGSLFYYSAF